MSGWLIQVGVKRFGTESGTPSVHLYAAWMADAMDALAAIEKRVDAPDEVPELLVELSDGALISLGLSRREVCRVCCCPLMSGQGLWG
jgi:hypothetical protein